MGSRHDWNTNVIQAFTHDSMNRLSSSTLNSIFDASYTYDAAGNLTYHSDIGTYAYADPAHPHGVTAAGPYTYTYDANGNATSKRGRVFSWASFDLPTQLFESTALFVVGPSAQMWSTYAYGPDRNLYKEVSSDENRSQVTTYFLDGLERVVPPAGATEVEQWRHNLVTPSGTRLLFTRTVNGAKLYSIVTDVLGSTTSVIEDNTGAVKFNQSFDPFGSRQAATGWSGAADMNFSWVTSRGFTGHLQGKTSGFVHMGGRVYDQNVGRFLSVDPVMGDGAPQRLNAYSYVNNRPLSFVDPTGLDEAEAGEDTGRQSIEVVGTKMAEHVPGVGDKVWDSTTPSGMTNWQIFTNPVGTNADLLIQVTGLKKPRSPAFDTDFTYDRKLNDDVTKMLKSLGPPADSSPSMSKPAVAEPPRYPAVNAVLGKTVIRTTVSFFMGVPLISGVSVAVGTTVSDKGLGLYGNVMGIAPGGLAGVSGSTIEGRKPGEAVGYAGSNTVVGVQSDDAFLGPNLYISLPGVFYGAIGEYGFAVNLPVVPGKIGAGIGVSNPEAAKALKAHTLRSFQQAWEGCPSCMAW